MRNWILTAAACFALACSADEDAADSGAAGAADGAASSDAARGQGGAGGGGGGGGALADAAPVPDARAPDAGSPDAAAPDAALDCADQGVVRFETEDGVELVADFYPAPGSGRGAVLFHMIPPGNTRANYPPAFIEALVARGFSVLNVDRRGAGDSSGVAIEAYEGPNGRLDAIAARQALIDSGCGVDGGQIALVGASNGTTTALDYAVRAGDAAPAALVFLTGGGYTENQNRVADHRDVLDPLPILFVFSTAERAWSAQFQDAAPDTWAFQEYASGAHGTRMFGAAPASVAAVADFLDEAVE